MFLLAHGAPYNYAGLFNHSPVLPVAVSGTGRGGSSGSWWPYLVSERMPHNQIRDPDAGQVQVLTTPIIDSTTHNMRKWLHLWHAATHLLCSTFCILLLGIA